MNDLIDSFFMDPSTPPVFPSTFSQLYLLRRDISICFGMDPSSGQEVSSRVLFPGVMAICAGIDLIGKFLAGDDTVNQVGPRFKKFLTTYFQLDDCEAETIYQLRNSLLHSFGLYSRTRDRQYKFVLGRKLNSSLTVSDSGIYTVDIDAFRSSFDQAIAQYEADVRADPRLQANFDTMCKEHRGIHIEGTVIPAA